MSRTASQGLIMVGGFIGILLVAALTFVKPDQGGARGAAIGAGLGLVNLGVGYLVTRRALRHGMKSAMATLAGGFIARLFVVVSLMLLFRRTDSIDPAATAGVSTPADPAPAEDVSFQKMKEGMKGVTSGLSTAFDTTLYGLVATIFLLFPTELLRKSEYATLDKIEVYANESLLRRMSEGGPSLDKDPVGFAREALQAAEYGYMSKLMSTPDAWASSKSPAATSSIARCEM